MTTPAHIPFGKNAADDATVAATLLDALVVEEVSLVPSGANQHAAILAAKAETPAAPVPMLEGLRRAFRALVEKVAPGDAAVAAEVDAGLSDAATAEAVSASVSPPAGSSGTGAEGAPASPSASSESQSMSQNATPATPSTDEVVAKAAEARAAEIVAKAQQEAAAAIARAEAIEKANTELTTRLEVLEKAARETALRDEFSRVFGGVTVAKAHEPGLLTLLAKASDNEKDALKALGVAFAEVAKTAQLMETHGRSGAAAPLSAPAEGSAAAAAEAAAQAIVAKEAVPYAVAYAKALDLDPALAARVMREEHDAVKANGSR